MDNILPTPSYPPTLGTRPGLTASSSPTSSFFPSSSGTLSEFLKPTPHADSISPTLQIAASTLQRTPSATAQPQLTITLESLIPAAAVIGLLLFGSLIWITYGCCTRKPRIFMQTRGHGSSSSVGGNTIITYERGEHTSWWKHRGGEVLIGGPKYVHIPALPSDHAALDKDEQRDIERDGAHTPKGELNPYFKWPRDDSPNRNSLDYEDPDAKDNEEDEHASFHTVQQSPTLDKHNPLLDQDAHVYAFPYDDIFSETRHEQEDLTPRPPSSAYVSSGSTSYTGYSQSLASPPPKSSRLPEPVAVSVTKRRAHIRANSDVQIGSRQNFQPPPPDKEIVAAAMNLTRPDDSPSFFRTIRTSLRAVRKKAKSSEWKSASVVLGLEPSPDVSLGAALTPAKKARNVNSISSTPTRVTPTTPVRVDESEWLKGTSPARIAPLPLPSSRVAKQTTPIQADFNFSFSPSAASTSKPSSSKRTEDRRKTISTNPPLPTIRHVPSSHTSPASPVEMTKVKTHRDMLPQSPPQLAFGSEFGSAGGNLFSDLDQQIAFPQSSLSNGAQDVADEDDLDVSLMGRVDKIVKAGWTERGKGV